MVDARPAPQAWVDLVAKVAGQIGHRRPVAVKNVADLDEHHWPSTDMFDYGSFPEKLTAIQAERERCLMVANGNIFESSWYMRGFEQIFLDMALNPDLVHAIHGRVTDFYVAHFREMPAAAAGAVDLAFTADDISGQNGPLMSPAMWEEFLLNYQKPIIEMFGLCGYGCCENLTHKIDGVLSIPNLRIFVSSAWSATPRP